MKSESINLNERIVLIRDEETRQFKDPPDEVSGLELVEDDEGNSNFIITYKNKEKETYKRSQARYASFKDNIDIEENYIYLDNEEISPLKVEVYDIGYDDSDIFRIIFNNGEVKYSQYVLIKKKGWTDRIVTYYKELAKYALTIIEDQKHDPLFYLVNQYEDFHFNINSALYSYLRGKSITVTQSEDYYCEDYDEYEFEQWLFFPFEYNKEQYAAINMALSKTVSIIEGPPGTGKTETILNLICNIVANDSNVAVVSNNNSAVENIEKKFKEVGLDFILASLGNSVKMSDFFASKENGDEALKKFRNDYEGRPRIKLLTEIQNLDTEMRKINKLETEIASYKEELSQIKRENKSENISASQLAKDYSYSNANRIKTLTELIDKNTSDLESRHKEEISAQIKAYSIAQLNKKLYDHYLTKRDLNSDFNVENYKNDFKHFVWRYPVVMSTTFSLMNNIEEGFLFDFLIVDEASQADLLAAVLAMNCARQVVIVGDSRQLQAIEEERLTKESKRLARDMKIPWAYVYSDSNSLLKSVKSAVRNVPTTQLKQHYRCAPDIIRFCNNNFYDNELIPMTDNGGNKQHLFVIKTVPGNHARKSDDPELGALYNQREIDVIEKLVKEKGWSDDEYGIITPFRIQVKHLTETLKDRKPLISTVHKFQGQQRSKIILSFVVNGLGQNEVEIENRLDDFVTDEKLLNVAVSRAIDELYIIVSDGVYNYHNKDNSIRRLIDYIEGLYGKESTVTSNITSIFDYLYKHETEHTDWLIEKNHYDDKTNPSEALFAEIADEVLKEKRYLDISFKMHEPLKNHIKNWESYSRGDKSYLESDDAHMDFMFYNINSKAPLFAIEIDGVEFHEQNEEQLEHDSLKDEALKNNDIIVYRFKTNEANEEERLKSILNEYS